MSSRSKRTTLRVVKVGPPQAPRPPKPPKELPRWSLRFLGKPVPITTPLTPKEVRAAGWLTRRNGSSATPKKARCGAKSAGADCVTATHPSLC
jgi:hypothetical protein